MWPTWNQAAIAAAVLLTISQSTRRAEGRWHSISLLAGETALVSLLYVLWQLAGALPLTHAAGALRRGAQVQRFEDFVHLPSERTAEDLIINHPLLARACNIYYATMHGPTLLVFLVWLFIRHRDRYGRWRNALVILTGSCLFIRFLRVAPPRLMPELGFVDLAVKYGQSVYGPVGTGVSDQFAAMPSIHVGWAALVGLGAVASSTSRWRHVVLLHVLATVFVVSATANHWWLDGVVAIMLLGLGLGTDTVVRRLAQRGRSRRSTAGGPVLEPLRA